MIMRLVTAKSMNEKKFSDWEVMHDAIHGIVMIMNKFISCIILAWLYINVTRIITLCLIITIFFKSFYKRFQNGVDNHAFSFGIIRHAEHASEKVWEALPYSNHMVIFKKLFKM